MSLKHYHVNAQKLSLEERTALFDKIDGFSFMTTLDPNNPGCINVFWNFKKDIEEVISFPPQCTITTICKSE